LKWRAGKQKTFLLEQNSEITLTSELSSQTPLSEVSDSVYILFNNERQIVYKRDAFQTNKNIFNIDNYEGGYVDYGVWRYRYYITSEDYQNATIIK
jgi:hypothetical protein